MSKFVALISACRATAQVAAVMSLGSQVNCPEVVMLPPAHQALAAMTASYSRLPRAFPTLLWHCVLSLECPSCPPIRPSSFRELATSVGSLPSGLCGLPVSPYSHSENEQDVLMYRITQGVR